MFGIVDSIGCTIGNTILSTSLLTPIVILPLPLPPLHLITFSTFLSSHNSIVSTIPYPPTLHHRGLANIEAYFIATQIIFPAILWLLDFLLTPYFLARLIGLFITSYTTQTLLVRYSFILYVALRGSIYVTEKLCNYVMGLYNEIRDSRYLVGE